MNIDFIVGLILGGLILIMVDLVIAYCYIDRWEHRLQSECDKVIDDIKSHGCIGYDNKGRDK